MMQQHLLSVDMHNTYNSHNCPPSSQPTSATMSARAHDLTAAW